MRRTAPSWLTARPIAHRGFHARASGRPENSLAAAKAAVARNFAIEADLRLSCDGEIFVFHDDALDRLTDANGPFSTRRATELQKIRLKCSQEGDGEEGIPTLGDLLATVRGAAPLILEMKSDFSGDLALAKALPAVLGDYSGPAAVKSFDPALIAALRAQGVRWPLGVVAQTDYDDAEFASLSAARKFALARFTHAGETRPDFLSWRRADLPNPVCELARAFGAPVMSWTIRTAEQAREALRNADQVIFEGFLP